MSIGFGKSVPGASEVEAPEEVLSVPQFFQFAAVLNGVMDSARLDGEAEAAEFSVGWGKYIGKDREANEARFVDYCEKMAAMHEVLEQEYGAFRSALTGRGMERPDASLYDPDLKAFLGRLILSQEPIEPGEAAPATRALMWIALVLDGYVIHYTEEEPELATQFQFALDIVDALIAICVNGLESGEPIAFTG